MRANMLQVIESANEEESKSVQLEEEEGLVH